MDLSDREAGIVRRFAVAGAVGDLLSEQLVERDARRVERVARPLHEGRSGLLMKVSKACTAASLLLTLWPSRRRGLRLAAGILGTAGAIAVKFGIAEAGTASAADPRATFHQQRAGLGGNEATGSPAGASPR
jgi:hypothetical protein